MTTEPKNELPDEIYYRPDGTFWLQKPDDSAIVYTRPAKAVQGDKNYGAAPLLKRYTDDAGNEMIAVAAWFYDELVSCLPDEAPALTPESEGIAKDSAFLPRTMTEEEITAITAWYAEKHGVEGMAGKVDLTYDQIDRLIDMHLGKEDMHELDRGNLQWFVNKVLEAATLTRPQEIDVEDIRREMAIAADKKYSGNELFDGPRTVNNPSGLFYIGMKFAIDHLVASGYLSKAKE